MKPSVRRGPPFVLERATVTIPATGHLVVAVVSDTHSKADPRALAQLAVLKPDLIVHGGDVGDEAVLDQLAAIAPVHAVRGNIDTRTTLPDGLVLTLAAPDGAAALRLLLTHVAVAGPIIRADAAKRARAERCGLIICGHSHVPFVGAQKGLTVFNPGSIGPRRFTLPILYGVLRLGPREVTLKHVDCETGLEWQPPR